MSAALTLRRLEEAGVRLSVDGEILRLRGQQPEPALLAEAKARKAELIRLVAGREAEEIEEREAIQAEAMVGRPGPEHRRQVEGLIASALQRPPSWADAASCPAPGSYCGCCGRFDAKPSGRWWRERENPSGWCCWSCHPPVHLQADEVVEVRT